MAEIECSRTCYGMYWSPWERAPCWLRFAVPTWLVSDVEMYNWPLLRFLGGLAIPGGPDPGGVVTKFLGCWLLYAVLVFVPFQIEYRLPRPEHGWRGLPLIRESRVLRTSVPMLVLGSAFYCWLRFRPEPGGLDAGVGSMIVRDWLAPLLALGFMAALAALVVLLYGKVRGRISR